MTRRMEGDNPTRRRRGRRARRDDLEAPSQAQVTSGASKQPRHLGGDHPHAGKRAEEYAGKQEGQEPRVHPRGRGAATERARTAPPPRPSERTLTTRAGVVGDVRRRAGLGEPEAERALEATLAVLSDRVAEETAERLRSELPAELAAHLDPERRTTVEHEAFPVEEFVRRMAQHEGVPGDVAETHLRSVLRSLGAALRPAGVHDLRDSLSADYAELWAPER